ncbi:hypothetical protein [Streptomyces sp. ALB3]
MVRQIGRSANGDADTTVLRTIMAGPINERPTKKTRRHGSHMTKHY